MNRSLRSASIAFGLLISGDSGALDINVVGLFPSKAVVQIDGGALQTLSVGQKSREGAVLISADRDAATFDVGDGQHMTVGLGHARMKASDATPSAKMTANERGHFVTTGWVNGVPVRFAVDTGATYISLSASEARRLELDYRKGRKVIMETGNGNAPGYRIKLDAVRVGDVTVNSVDAVVMEGDDPRIALLGMSFLNRMNITREGEIMTLTKRY
jgi:aspartyl protease family protein